MRRWLPPWPRCRRGGNESLQPVVEWQCGANQIACTISGMTVFRDWRDHWEQGVLRLLGLTDTAGRVWVEDVAAQCAKTNGKLLSACSAEEKLNVLSAVSPRHFLGAPLNLTEPPAGTSHLTALGRPVNCQWVSQIRDRRDLAVVGNRELRHAILVQQDSVWSCVQEAEYDESYFEGNLKGVGYGSYTCQSTWRFEKAVKLVQRIRGIAASVGHMLNEGACLLDVGSGYGYFRKAAEADGWRHQGIEISLHAIQAAEKMFGFSTFAGQLEDFVRGRPGTFDVITLFDTIEHVTDPLGLIATIRELLAPRGFCVIRTPNLLALEVGVFGGWYHSFKREHLHYFSPDSLCWLLEQAGLAPVFLTSDSHLLSGFLGPALHRYARLLFGSDLFAAGQRLT